MSENNSSSENEEELRTVARQFLLTRLAAIRAEQSGASTPASIEAKTAATPPRDNPDEVAIDDQMAAFAKKGGMISPFGHNAAVIRSAEKKQQADVRAIDRKSGAPIMILPSADDTAGGSASLVPEAVDASEFIDQAMEGRGADGADNAVSPVPVGDASQEPMSHTSSIETDAAIDTTVVGSEAVTADLEAAIVALRDKVAVARTAFITAEESQGSTWKKLMQTFRTLKHRESDDREVQAYHNAYDQAVLVLQGAELEKLKQSGLSLKQLRPEMAALIREIQFDEAEQIYTERRQQRLEKTNQSLGEKLDMRWSETIGSLGTEAGTGEKWKQYIKYFLGASAAVGEAAVQGVEKLGQANNEFSKKYGKYILTATVTVGGAVALGAATGGVASAALGALALKRLAAGAGLAVAAEAGMDKYAASRREKKRANVETDQAGLFQKMEDAVETREVEAIATGKEGDGKLDLSLLEAFLKDEAAKARKGEGARRRNALLRKSGAIFAGAVLGSGAVSHFARGITVVDSPVPLVGSASMPSDIAGAASAAATVEHGTGMSAKVTDFLSTYEVKRGDNIWQLAEKAVKGVPGMEGRHSNRFAKLVELKLQEKLESSPELARAAGFVSDANGKFSVHAIQAGTKLELGKLISAEDMAKLVEEAKGDAPIRVAAASLEAPTGSVPVDPLGQGLSLEAKEHGLSLDQVSGEGLRAERGVKVALNAKSLEPAQITVVPEEAVDGVVELRPEAALTRPDGQVMDYVGNLSREEQEHLFQNFRKLSAALFETDEVMNAEGYDRSFNPIPHAELAKTKLADILADHKALSRNPVFMYDRMKNPLHWSQMQEIDRLAKASAKVFGEEIARARNGESIQEYVLRVVALAGHEGKKIPGFRMLH